MKHSNSTAIPKNQHNMDKASCFCSKSSKSQSPASRGKTHFLCEVSLKKRRTSQHKTSAQINQEFIKYQFQKKTCGMWEKISPKNGNSNVQCDINNLNFKILFQVNSLKFDSSNSEQKFNGISRFFQVNLTR
jgi:hypothetical protein